MIHLSIFNCIPHVVNAEKKEHAIEVDDEEDVKVFERICFCKSGECMSGKY